MQLKNQIRYYYLKSTKPGNPGLHPYGCMALVLQDGKIWRGVSFCSPKDQFSKTEAKRIALQNARFLEHMDMFSLEDMGANKRGTPHRIVKINGIAGSDDLRKSILLTAKRYGVDLFDEAADTNGRFYSKARKETWESLTEMERHIFFSNSDGAGER